MKCPLLALNLFSKTTTIKTSKSFSRNMNMSLSPIRGFELSKKGRPQKYKTIHYFKEYF